MVVRRMRVHQSRPAPLVRPHTAVGQADELLHEERVASRRALTAEPDGAVADAVRGGREAEPRPRDRQAGGRTLVEIRQQLAGSGARRGGVGGAL